MAYFCLAHHYALKELGISTLPDEHLLLEPSLFLLLVSSLLRITQSSHHGPRPLALPFRFAPL